MKKNDLPRLPTKPGVYFFLNDKKILYIGKAASLKDRVGSYFSHQEKSRRGLRIVKMVELANGLKWQETDSVIEAFLLENSLIKRYQPLYNYRDKDNKSFLYLLITKEDFPRVLAVRGRDIERRYHRDEIDEILGPFPSGLELKEAMKILRQIFPWRDKCKPVDKKPCFNFQIGLCPGVCTGAISSRDYKRIIKNLKLFLIGQKEKVIKNLEKEMNLLSKDKKFEKAIILREQLKALRHIKDISLLKDVREDNNIKIEAYDIAHFSGRQAVGAMAVVENGEVDKSAGRYFILKSKKALNGNDPASLEEVISRRIKHQEWPYPDIIAVDGGVIQFNVADRIISENNLDIKVVAITKNDKRQFKKIVSRLDVDDNLKKDLILSTALAHELATGFNRKKIREMLK